MNEQKNNEATTQTPAPVEQKRPKKKKRGRKFMLFIIIVLFIWWFNNFTLKTSNFIIYSDKVSSDFRIAVISDLHASEYGISNKTILKSVEKAKPDIVFMLGDMYSRDGEWEQMKIPIDLTEMIVTSGYPVYFVPGEHDTAQKFIDGMSSAGAHVMDYKSEIINVNGNNVEILGIDNVYFSSTFNLNNAFTLTDGCYSILMAHIPMYEQYSSFGANLTICGDTHGGIIQLPFSLGPAYYSETNEWFPELSGYRSDVFDKGLFPYTGGNMFITSGIGAHPIAARLNNRPEIAVIDIKSAENN